MRRARIPEYWIGSLHRQEEVVIRELLCRKLTPDSVYLCSVFSLQTGLMVVLFISNAETSSLLPPQPASYLYSVIAWICGQARISLVIYYMFNWGSVSIKTLASGKTDDISLSAKCPLVTTTMCRLSVPPGGPYDTAQLQHRTAAAVHGVHVLV